MNESKTYLECTTGNHNKFYDVTVRGTKVIGRWGGIGWRKPRTQTWYFDTASEAEDYAKKKINELFLLSSERVYRGFRR